MEFTQEKTEIGNSEMHACSWLHWQVEVFEARGAPVADSLGRKGSDKREVLKIRMK